MIFTRRIGTGPLPLTLSREAGYNHTRTELIHLQHPLTRFALSELERGGVDQQAAFAISLNNSNFPSGNYAFFLVTTFINSYRPTAKLVAIIIDRDSDRTWIDPEETTPVLVQMLEHGRDVEIAPPSYEESDRIKEKLLASFEQLRKDWDTREKRLDQARREQQYISRKATLEFLAQKAEDRLTNLLEKQAAEFAIRMARARSEKAQRELNAFLNNPHSSDWGGIEYEEIAVGFLQIEIESE
jgi:hypothetical protein